nr:ubiquinol oxidase subunit II [Novosphingopyxis iocasae]
MLRFVPAIGLAALLSGCDMVVLNPMGDVAVQQRNLLVFALALMLLIVIPVIALVGIFAWKYRANNKEARYDPDWDHSTKLELVIWSAPLLIVICLGAATWTGTHLLDPYRPIERITKGEPVPANVKPLEVQVVSLDWKWLFIYPEYGFATVNELAAPVDRPIKFRLTSSSVMNAFYVPTLVGMIYTMPSMETQLHAVINEPGNYDGFSSNYSGAGFSGMRFRFHGMEPAQFDQWVAMNQADGDALTRASYLQLAKPTENVPVMRYGRVAPDLFNLVVNHCVEPGSVCMSEMMKMDRADPSSIDDEHGMSMPQGHQPQRPLNSADAGEEPPQSPADVDQRSRSAPGALDIPSQRNN